MYLPRLDWIPKKSRLFNTQTLLKLATFLLLVLALSSPIAYDAISPSQKHGRDIVLALDTSGSMRETGFSHDSKGTSKFALLQTLVADFIDKRVSDNIGVVAFGTFAFSPSPITYDHQSLKELLSMLEVEIAGKNTAIGDAINQSLTTLSFAQAKEKVIILITDGISNAGSVSIQDAVLKAKNQHVKIFTIGLGSEKEFDAQLLKRISAETFAKSFAAKDAQSLHAVYDEIDALIPSTIRSEQYLDKKALFPLPLLLAMLLLFGLLAREKGIF
jgi:Ca-activated chloride channel family protein